MKLTIFALIISIFVFILGLSVVKLPTEDLNLQCTYLKQDMCITKQAGKIKSIDISNIDKSKLVVGDQVTYQTRTVKQQLSLIIILDLFISSLVFLFIRFYKTINSLSL